MLEINLKTLSVITTQPQRLFIYSCVEIEHHVFISIHFHYQVTKTLNRKLVHLFHINRLQCIRIYLHPDDAYDQLQDLIQEQTDVAPNKQILLYKNTHFSHVIEPETSGKSK